MDRRVEALAGKQGAYGDEGHNTAHGEQRDDEYRTPVGSDDGWIDHHAHRHEEDGSEEVLDARDQMLYMLSLNRFGEDRAHHERAEGRGESNGGSKGHHAEAESDGDDQEYLVVEVVARPVQE